MPFRSIIVIVILSIAVFQIQARTTPTVSGVAVAAQWHGYNNNDGTFGGFGKIMKYVVTNGTTTSRTVLYAGDSSYRGATISTDGQKVAFMSDKNKSIYVMSASGGAAEAVVTNLVSGKSYMGWPTGNWLYYFRAGIDKNDSTAKQLWKVDVTTKQVQLVTKFNPDSNSTSRYNGAIWQFDITMDGTKAAVRPDFGGGSRFAINNVLNFGQWDSLQFGDGCGTAISPSGAYLMSMASTCHCGISFFSYSPINASAGYWQSHNIGDFSMATMDSWGVWIGTGMNSNHWSANDDKWLCLQTCWDGRYGLYGSNQVLVNWIDSQTVRTSDADSTATNPQQNEPGDFWVGNPGTVPSQVATPTASPDGGNFTDSVRVTLTCGTSGASVYYTTDGSTPTSSKPLYTASFKLTATTTVKAIGIKTGSTSSAVFSATFTKTSTPPVNNGTWTGIDLGGSQPAGSFTKSTGGLFTIQGGGGAPGYWWAPSDKLYFVYQPVSGDCQIVAHLINVTKVTGDNVSAPVAGIMIRGNLTEKAPNVAFGEDASNGTLRAETYSTDTTGGFGATNPNDGSERFLSSMGWFPDVWMKIVRQGNVFSCYHAQGTTMPTSWGTATTVRINDMPASAYVGFAVCNNTSASVTSNNLVTATFDNVTVTGNLTNAVNPAGPYQMASGVIKTPVVRTEYYNVNGRRLGVRNGTVVAPARSVVIVRHFDANGLITVDRRIMK